MKTRNPFGTKKETEKFCKKNSITYLGVFGSYARGDDHEGSDIDFLFRIDHSKRSFSLFDLVNLKDQLEDQFDRPIDLVSKLNPYVEPYVQNDLVTLYDEKR